MRRALLTGLAVAIMSLSWVAPPSVESGQVRIQRRVDVVPVPVFVTDGRGRHVAGLTGADFELSEDGVPQEIDAFDEQSSPVAAVLVLDASGSMTPMIEAVKVAAAGFVNQLAPNDVANVLQFSAGVVVLQEFTSEKSALLAALARITVGGPTALLNALIHGLAELEREARGPGGAGNARRKRAIVILSDGDDTASMFTEDDVTRRARESDAVIYAVRLRSDAEDEHRIKEEPGPRLLELLATESGGRLMISRGRDLARSYAQIADELRHQYVLGYVSTNTARNGAFRRLVVTLKGRRDLRLRYKPGYYATR